MNNVGVIDVFLNTFTRYIDSGFGLVNGDVLSLSATLSVLDIVIAGLFWAWGADEDVIQRLVKKTLYVGFFAFVIGKFDYLSQIIFNSFASLGLKAGSSQITQADFLRPGRLAEVGFTAGQPLLDAAAKLVGPVAIFTNAIQILVLCLSWVIIIAAFFVLAVQLFVTLIEFKLTCLAGFVLIPFALFNRTAFLAEKVLGNIVSSGVKVMVLAVICGIGSGLFAQFTTSYGSNQPTIGQALSVVLAALSLLGLGIFGGGIATGLISGAPQLGAGAAVGTGLAVGAAGAAAVAGVGAVATGGGAALAATAAAARGGAAAAGAASTAYTMASAGQNGAAGVASGLGGVGRAAAGAAAGAVKDRAASAAGTMKESFASGSRGAFRATGGSSTQGTVGGENGEGAPSADDTGNASASPEKPPRWARQMKRGQAARHATEAANIVRSADGAGGSSSIDLSEKE